MFAVTGTGAGGGNAGGGAKEDVIKDFVVGTRIYPVCIISYERVRMITDALAKVNFDLIVCDEGHRLKSGQIKTALVGNGWMVVRGLNERTHSFLHHRHHHHHHHQHRCRP